MFEFLIRVSKTTVSPSRSLISQVNQCLRAYVSIYQPQCADKRSIHINCRWLHCLWTTQQMLHENHVPVVRSRPSRTSVTHSMCRLRVPVLNRLCCSCAQTQVNAGSSQTVWYLQRDIDLRAGSRSVLHWKQSDKPQNILETEGAVGLPVWANTETNGLCAAGSHGDRVTHLCGAVRASQLRQRQVEQKVYAEAGRRYGSGTCARKGPYSLGSSAAMNREDHYYPSQVFKDSCAYQRSQGEDYSHSPPPCLYMNRQVHSVYTPPSMGALEQASLPDIAPSYSLPNLRDDPGVPQLHHPQGLHQQALQPAAGYGDTVEQSRYHLPFPWMKTTKSHSHTWKGQWAGKLSKPSTNGFCFKIQRRESMKRDLLLFYNTVIAYQKYMDSFVYCTSL